MRTMNLGTGRHPRGMNKPEVVVERQIKTALVSFTEFCSELNRQLHLSLVREKLEFRRRIFIFFCLEMNIFVKIFYFHDIL